MHDGRHRNEPKTKCPTSRIRRAKEEKSSGNHDHPTQYHFTKLVHTGSGQTGKNHVLPLVQVTRIGQDQAKPNAQTEKDLTRSSHLSPGVRLVQRIVLGDAPDGAALQVEPGAWSLRLPRADLLDYVARLPCRDALAYVLPGGAADAPLYVGIEVDVRDSVRRRGPRRRGTGTAPDPTAE